MHYACVFGHAEVVELLLDYGRGQEDLDFNQRNIKGKTAFSLACASKESTNDVVKLLLTRSEEYGIDIMAKDKWDRSPLHLAALKGRNDNVKAILEFAKSKKIDVNQLDFFGRTPFHCAEMAHNDETEQVFREMSNEMEICLKSMYNFTKANIF